MDIQLADDSVHLSCSEEEVSSESTSVWERPSFVHKQLILVQDNRSVSLHDRGDYTIYAPMGHCEKCNYMLYRIFERGIFTEEEGKRLKKIILNAKSVDRQCISKQLKCTEKEFGRRMRLGERRLDGELKLKKFMCDDVSPYRFVSDDGLFQVCFLSDFRDASGRNGVFTPNCSFFCTYHGRFYSGIITKSKLYKLFNGEDTKLNIIKLYIEPYGRTYYIRNSFSTSEWKAAQRRERYTPKPRRRVPDDLMGVLTSMIARELVT